MDVVVALTEGPEKGALFLFIESESSDDEEGILEEGASLISSRVISSYCSLSIFF
jgi:hypothetical protein